MKKLHKYWIELDRQNDIIFEVEKQRNSLEFERDDLKGLAKLTKKKGLDSEIAQKNQQIDLLKIGLSNMVNNFGFANMREFYIAYRFSQQAYYEYHDDVAKWEETYNKRTSPKVNTISEQLKRYQEEELPQQHKEQTYRKSRGRL